MPNRLIKESIRTSKKVNKLSDFNFRFWTYLITYVDDYGRGSADPELLKGFVFPRRPKTSEAQINVALHELERDGMILLYEVDGESFFCFPNWDKHQQIRAKKSKYPAPDITCNQMISDDSKCPRNPIQSESNPNRESESESESNPKARDEEKEIIIPFEGELKAAFTDWIKYKRERHEIYKPSGLQNLITQVRKHAERYGDEEMIDAIRNSMASNYQGITFDRVGKQNSEKARDKKKSASEYTKGDFFDED